MKPLPVVALAAMLTLPRAASAWEEEEADPPLIEAVKLHSMMELEELLANKGTKINLADAQGMTALAWAVEEMQQDMIEPLLARGAKPDLADQDGLTPLMRAAEHCDAAALEALLKRKPKVNLRDKTGDTAFARLVRGECYELAGRLLGAGLDPKVRDNRGWTPLMLAVWQRQLGLARALLDRKADPNAADSEGVTALMLAVQASSMGPAENPVAPGVGKEPAPERQSPAEDWAALVRLLLERGAKPQAKSKAGHTAADWARMMGLGAVEAVLADKAAPPAPAAAQALKAAAPGYNHFCLLVANGNVACWGDNFSGALGDGLLEHHDQPQVIPSLVGVTQLCSGSSFSCALTREGTVRCWGNNGGGQVGVGYGLSSFRRPAQVPKLDSVQQIACGQNHVCARRADGTLRCWGENEAGQLGLAPSNYPSRTPEDPGIKGAVDLAAGGFVTCVRLESGAARCFGSNSWLQTGWPDLPNGSTAEDIPGLEGVVALGVGQSSTCAALKDGTVRCWGKNDVCQLGAELGSPAGKTEQDKAQEHSATPVTVTGVKGVVELDAGGTTICGRTADNKVFCWGGVARSYSCDYPNRTPYAAEAASVAVGYDNACVVDLKGNARCWGEQREANREFKLVK